LRLPLTSAMFSRTRSPVVNAESTGGRDETGACPGRRDRRGQRAREAIATASGRSPVMKLEAVAGPGSVARVSQESGVEDARRGRQRAMLKTLQQPRQVDVTALAQRFGVSGMTIRRDLAELDEAGQLQRVHGGGDSPGAPALGPRA